LLDWIVLLNAILAARYGSHSSTRLDIKPMYTLVTQLSGKNLSTISLILAVWLWRISGAKNKQMTNIAACSHKNMSIKLNLLFRFRVLNWLAERVLCCDDQDVDEWQSGGKCHQFAGDQ
jgi:hypothetical protein